MWWSLTFLLVLPSHILEILVKMCLNEDLRGYIGAVIQMGVQFSGVSVTEAS